MARATMTRPRLRALALAVPALIGAILSAAAQAPASRPSPQMAAAQAGFEALPEAERKAIQTDLIWTGHFNGAVSGAFGPLTFRAINAVKAGARGAPDGLLSPAERATLAKAAQAARNAAGFRLVDDGKTGVRIGIPTKLLPKRSETPSGGGRWQSADERITLDTSASPPGDDLAALFEKATSASVPGRRITYKLLRPDFFVVTGETQTGRFYRRLAAGPEGLRGFSIGYDKALAASVDRLVIAIAASFEPFPGAAAPSAPPSTMGGTTNPTAPPALPVARPTERHGVALALSDRVAITAAAALEGCRALRVAERPAKLRTKDEASGLALIDLDAGAAGIAPGLRAEPLAGQETVILAAFGEQDGKRAALALPGQSLRGATGSAIFAPLQPGQSGSPVFDRQGRLAGIVIGDPSGKVLIAGIAPQRAYAIADGAALQALATKAGLSLAAAPAEGELSTGAVIDRVGKAVLPISCAL